MPTNPPVSVAAMARGLSEAQRRALVGEMRSIGNPECFILLLDGLDLRMMRTIGALACKGMLGSGRFGKTMLTPLGLQVRNHLLAPEDTNEGDVSLPSRPKPQGFPDA